MPGSGFYFSVLRMSLTPYQRARNHSVVVVQSAEGGSPPGSSPVGAGGVFPVILEGGDVFTETTFYLWGKTRLERQKAGLRTYSARPQHLSGLGVPVGSRGRTRPGRVN